ncbi:MAG: single-stranded DNA-binding protein [Thermostichales cyanobacterium BF4_bins_65]
MNSIILMGEILQKPELRYTPDKLPVASLLVQFPSLRPEEPPYQIRVSVFGQQAQTAVETCQVGQQVLIEGQLHINTIERDGRNEKRPEINARRLHLISGTLISSPAQEQVEPPVSQPGPSYDVDPDEIPF